MSNNTEPLGPPSGVPTVSNPDPPPSPPEPRITAPELQIVRPPELERNELWTQPYMIGFERRNKPPTRALAEAGERAFQELGLSNPTCPSLHFNPPCYRQTAFPHPETRESYAQQAAECRSKAQRYASTACQWGRKAADAADDLARVGRGEIGDECEREKRESIVRRAPRLVASYEERAMLQMTHAYVNALMALRRAPARGEARRRWFEYLDEKWGKKEPEVKEEETS